MADSQSFDSIVEKYIQPLIATNVNSSEDGKSVGILVGIMFVGARNYYSFGSIRSSGVATEEVVSFIGSNTKVFTATLLGLADY
jgi:beta-lactamase class C